MSDIQPALTPEEWTAGSHTIHAGITVLDDGGATTVELPNGSMSFIGPHRHAVAAFCLHGQPFGFTQEDVSALGELLEYAYSAFGGSVPGTEADPSWRRGKSLRDRIAALVPPVP